MKTALDPNQFPFDRQAELRVWLLRNRLTFVEIGRRMGGITGSAVQQLVQGDRISVRRHQEMLDLGIPAHLLPDPLDVPSGRPPRAADEATAAGI